eukprot:357880-Pleurochrysis_carterae.AAC.1
MQYSGATGTLELLYSTHPRANSCDRSIGLMIVSQWRATTAVSIRFKKVARKATVKCFVSGCVFCVAAF